MNEAGVFGRFVPDFGRVVAQMQFDMYHHYTVDEHTIRAIGLLVADRARRAARRTIRSPPRLFQQIASRRALYVAVLLHDIAKGRGGDHSVLGAEVALSALPAARPDRGRDRDRRLAGALAPADVRDRVQARPCPTPRRSTTSSSEVKSLERLRLLLLLTVVDIRAVGPGIWNSWKRQLLRDLFDAAEELLRLGHKQHGRKERIAAIQDELSPSCSAGSASRFAALRLAACPTAYWLAEPIDVLDANARFIDARRARAGEASRSTTRVWPERGATLVTRLRQGPARACSTASPARSASPAATSSTRASTPPTTAWRSTISSSRTLGRGPFARPPPADAARRRRC